MLHSSICLIPKEMEKPVEYFSLNHSVYIFNFVIVHDWFPELLRKVS